MEFISCGEKNNQEKILLLLVVVVVLPGGGVGVVLCFNEGTRLSIRAAPQTPTGKLPLSGQRTQRDETLRSLDRDSTFASRGGGIGPLRMDVCMCTRVCMGVSQHQGEVGGGTTLQPRN